MNKFAATIAALFLSVSAFAASPTPESVEKLLSVMKSESMVDSMYSSMENIMRQTMKQASLNNPPLSPEGQRVMDAFPAKYAEVMREEMSWQKMKPIYIKVYSETYDQVEIDGLTVFFSSAVGKSYNSKMPIMMQNVMGEMQSILKSFMPKMKAAMEKAAEEAKAAK